MDCETPGQAKRMARNVKIDPKFKHRRLKIMEKALRAKFENEHLKQLLLDTGNRILREGNDWGDTYWVDKHD